MVLNNVYVQSLFCSRSSYDSREIELIRFPSAARDTADACNTTTFSVNLCHWTRIRDIQHFRLFPTIVDLTKFSATRSERWNATVVKKNHISQWHVFQMDPKVYHECQRAGDSARSGGSECYDMAPGFVKPEDLWYDWQAQNKTASLAVFAVS